MKSNLEIEKSIRKIWAINPVTKVIKSKKRYNRKNNKVELKKMIEKGE